MKHNLLATTAIVALMSTSAFAQSETTVESDTMVGTEIGSSMFDDTRPMNMESVGGYFTASKDQILASSIMGETIYNGTGDDAEAVGDVNDVIMAPNGNAQAVVIGVGGFLGIGEKEVAVAFENVNVFERDGDTWLTINAGREDLEAAPEFDRSVFDHDDDMDMAMDTTLDADDSMDLDDDSMDVADDSNMAVDSDDDNNRVMNVVALDTLSANELIGARVYGTGDEDIGEIGDLILTDDGKVEAYIIDVGGFLGIGEKPVAMSAADLEIMQDENGWITVHTNFSQEQLEAHTTYDADAYASNPDAVLLR